MILKPPTEEDADVRNLHGLVTDSLDEIAAALAALDRTREEFKRPTKKRKRKAPEGRE